MRAALAAAPGERILDIGCGPGFYVSELLDEVGPDGSIVAVDASPDMLAMARHRCEGHDNVAFRDGNAAALPVDDGDFDAALCVQVMEYVPDPLGALAEIYRASGPVGGSSSGTSTGPPSGGTAPIPIGCDGCCRPGTSTSSIRRSHAAWGRTSGRPASSTSP